MLLNNDVGMPEIEDGLDCKSGRYEDASASPNSKLLCLSVGPQDAVKCLETRNKLILGC